MFAQPGDLHGGSTLRDARSLQVIRLPQAFVEQAATRKGFPLPLALRTRTSSNPEALFAFTELSGAMRQGRCVDEARALISRCTVALVHACDVGGGVPNAENPALRRARLHMRESIAGTCSLEAVACAACVDKFQLIKLFRDEYGLPPMKYLMHMRVARARTLLARGVPCTDAAHETGFYDQSHLNRWFHRVYGLNPGVYLRNRQTALRRNLDA
jgi:AraC-like DNA-binding protein